MAELTIAEVARIAGGEVERGDPRRTVRGVAPLDEAGPDDLSFVAEARYHPYIHASRAAAVLVARDAAVELPEGMAAVRVDDPRRALARVLDALYPQPAPAPGVHPTAVLGEGVVVDPTASVGAYAVIGDGTRVGARARIHPHVVVGRGCEIAEDALLHPHVTLYDDVTVGARSVIHSGARLGSDGFGFVPEKDGLKKVPQVGGCRIGEDVEVGANTTIDRGSIGDTTVGRGTKIDNLVQIGHNCRIGSHVIIVSQVGISGSTKVGDGAVLGGQAGVQGHIEIGAGARIGAQSGVTASVAAGATVSGYPARPHREALRVQAAVFGLPKLVERLKALEKAVFGRGAQGARAGSHADDQDGGEPPRDEEMPTTTPRQNTLARAGDLQGVGLHTGAEARMRILPAPVDTGIVFRRTDLPGTPDIPANLAHVVGTDLGTSIGIGEAKVHTVEHLLSAMVSREIDNAFVEIDAAELPAADGSARDFLRLLDGCGREEQDAPARYLAIAETFSLSKDRSEYIVAPAQDYRVSATIEFDHPLIGRQFASFRVGEPLFETEVLPARTFGFLRDVEAMRGRGLAMGGSQDNAVVLTEDGVLEGTQLRFSDEFVRHKALDVVGDLALVGARIRGHVIAERPGHLGNVALAREIVARAEKKALARPILNIEQIAQYLPHRYPFLLVDRVVEFEERKRIVGLKNVTINEPFFVGHFPGRPVMPGVLIIEAMAQVGGLLVLEQMENLDDKVVYFMSLDNVKWRRPVTPGDQIRFEVEVLQIRGATCRMRGVGTVDGHVVAEAEMMARVVDK